MAIGTGTNEMAKEFVEQFSIPYPIYSDPNKQTYALMGWKRTFGLGWQSIRKGWKEFSNGHRQGTVLGDPWQQGGEALIMQNGSVWWSNAADEAGTHTTVQELSTVLSQFKERALLH